MNDADHQTRAQWYALEWGDYHFKLTGTTGECLKLIPSSDGEIGITLVAINGVQACYLRPTEARQLAAELLRLAELV